MPRASLCCSILVTCALGLGANVSPRARPSTDQIAIDARVVDRNGAPIADLKPEDFLLELDGASRHVTSAQFVTARPTFWLAIDRASYWPSADPAMREAVNRLLARVTPADRVALSAFPGAIVVPPGLDRQAVNMALPRATGLWSESEVDQRTAQSLAGLTATIEAAGKVSGPKAIVVITAGIAMSVDPNAKPNLETTATEISRAANHADISIYTLYMNVQFLRTIGTFPVGLPLRDDLDRLARILFYLAADTNGTFYQIETGADRFVERLIADASSHYVLTIDLTPKEQDDKEHMLRLTTTMVSTAHVRPVITIPKR